MITCEAVQMLDDVKYKFDMFGIELVNQQTILLHPKNFTDSSFSDSEFRAENGNTFTFKIYNDADEQAKGFMIKEEACFNQLIEFFNAISKPVSSSAILNKNETQLPIYGLVLAA